MCWNSISTRQAQASSLPKSVYVDGVVGYPQQRALSCESRSASDFAAYFGVNVSEAQILAYVTKNPRTDNPNFGYVGNPDGYWGQIPPNDYGVHSNPIEDALANYGLPVYGERNLSWDFVRSEIANGRPVIVWVIGAMWSGTPVTYTDSEGRNAIVAAYEHTVILIGYNETKVWVVDAADGLTKSYPVESFLSSWQVLQNQALFYHVEPETPEQIFLPLIMGPDSDVSPDVVQETPTVIPDSIPSSYIVQPGDLLGEIANEYGVPWERLIEINDLPKQFLLTPGQEILISP